MFRRADVSIQVCWLDSPLQWNKKGHIERNVCPYCKSNHQSHRLETVTVLTELHRITQLNQACLFSRRMKSHFT